MVNQNKKMPVGNLLQPAFVHNSYLMMGIMLFFCLLLAGCDFDLHNQSRATENEPDWLFLRDGELRDNPDDLIEIIAVGDVMLGRGISDRYQPFRNTAQELVQADLVLGNFEGAMIPLCSSDSPDILKEERGQSKLVVNPSVVQSLQSAGFDLLNLANNHSLDAGLKGLEYTSQILSRSGIEALGAGMNRKASFQPIVRKIKGLRIAFFGVNAIRSPGDIPHSDHGWQIADWSINEIASVVREAKSNSDLVIIMVHWGDEYETRASPSQKNAARMLVEAGADIVIGTHPHVIQQTEIIEIENDPRRTAFVAYSLGNFVFDQFFENTRYGLALKFLIDNHGLAAVEALPVFTGFEPVWMDHNDASKVINRIRPAPKLIQYECSLSGCQQIDLPIKELKLESAVTITSDLTGDGNDEIIQLVNGRIQIVENGSIVWMSDDNWKISDLAVGDPNDDGRNEILIILTKKDDNGEEKCHPFLIGYRGGRYRQVWGGSAVRYPIARAVLLDLDDDRSEEIIVLEERSKGKYAITIWKWNEWVFDQVWSSPEDRFEGLNIVSTKPPTIVIGRKW